ncbi:hypothetical protein [Streptomyces sp. NPDC001401]|uniref:hypothetical protein n=1 Tax=Streptomyces sp. NPDC001401 TaxID=3364570 RepID=UPI0036BA0752
MISALAAAVGLIFSGIVTVLGAQAAQDQRQQQAADSARERRQQAAQISYWWEYSSKGEADLIINNRSLDPVYSLTVYLRYQSSWIKVPGEGNAPHQPRKGSTVGYEFDVVPPCTRLDLTEVVMAKTWQQSLDYVPDSVRLVEIPAMTFQDASGANWKRRETGLDALRDAAPGRSGVDFDVVTGGGLDGYRLSGGSTRPAEHCDQAS